MTDKHQSGCRNASHMYLENHILKYIKINSFKRRNYQDIRGVTRTCNQNKQLVGSRKTTNNLRPEMQRYASEKLKAPANANRFRFYYG